MNLYLVESSVSHIFNHHTRFPKPTGKFQAARNRGFMFKNH